MKLGYIERESVKMFFYFRI